MVDQNTVASFLAGLAGRGSLDASHVAIVVAHADDESIGAGAQLRRLAGVTIVHVTNGSPRSGEDARALGFVTRYAYAAARREELLAAMALARIPKRGLLSLAIIDQEAALDLSGLSFKLAEIFARRAIKIVLTHPYEGGHPDHDATAFAVNAARRLGGTGSVSDGIIEMAFYHLRRGERVLQRFPAEDRLPEIVIDLDDEGMGLKRRMVAEYRTQRRVLADFDARQERFRPAPDYDFSILPNEGELLYERFGWSMSGEKWLGLARAALHELQRNGYAEREA